MVKSREILSTKINTFHENFSKREKTKTLMQNVNFCTLDEDIFKQTKFLIYENSDIMDLYENKSHETFIINVRKLFMVLSNLSFRILSLVQIIRTLKLSYVDKV